MNEFQAAVAIRKTAVAGATAIAARWTEPDADFEPVMLMADADGKLGIVPIPVEAYNTAKDKAHLAEVFLPRYIERHGAVAAAIVTSAWHVQVNMATNEGFEKFLKVQAEGLEGEPVKGEALSIEVITPTTAFNFIGEITRHADGPPDIAEPKDAGDYQSRYVQPIQRAMQQGANN